MITVQVFVVVFVVFFFKQKTAYEMSLRDWSSDVCSSDLDEAALAAPEHLVDLRALKDLNYIREAGGQLHIGATASHYEVESSALLRQKCPLLTETAAAIGDVQVRNLGTIGGSVAHADPAADYPAALQALEAKFVLRSEKSERTLSAADLFVDALTTALQP